MKKLIIALILLVPLIAPAQTHNNYLGLNYGLSAFNAKAATLSLDKQIKGKNYIGVFVTAYFISADQWPINLKTGPLTWFGGMQYKPLIASSRNFSHLGMLGAAAGARKGKFTYYPAAGLEQNFHVGPRTLIFTTQEINYLLKEVSPWRVFLKAGVKLGL